MIEQAVYGLRVFRLSIYQSFMEPAAATALSHAVDRGLSFCIFNFLPGCKQLITKTVKEAKDHKQNN